jgi:hypothetical protein
MGRRFLTALLIAGSAAALSTGSALSARNVPSPSAADFAQQFRTLANAFALSQGYPVRVVHPDCVEASPRHYMCAYATRRPGFAEECRLMQAKWTPEAASPITITLAGRVPVCGSLRAALASLQAAPAA